MKIKRMTAKEAEAVKQDFIKEFNRLLDSGAVSDETRINTLYKVALENLSDNYGLGNVEDYANIRKF